MMQRDVAECSIAAMVPCLATGQLPTCQNHKNVFSFIQKPKQQKVGLERASARKPSKAAGVAQMDGALGLGLE